MWKAVGISWRLHELGLRFVYVSVCQPSKGNNPAMEFTGVVPGKMLLNEFSIVIGAGWCLSVTVFFFFCGVATSEILYDHFWYFKYLKNFLIWEWRSKCIGHFELITV